MMRWILLVLVFCGCQSVERFRYEPGGNLSWIKMTLTVPVIVPERDWLEILYGRFWVKPVDHSFKVGIEVDPNIFWLPEYYGLPQTQIAPDGGVLTPYPVGVLRRGDFSVYLDVDHSSWVGLAWRSNFVFSKSSVFLRDQFGFAKVFGRFWSGGLIVVLDLRYLIETYGTREVVLEPVN